MKNLQKVTQWITDGMDYAQGVNLLVSLSGKNSFYNQFNGNKVRLAPKLAYEICKASGLADVKTWKSFIASVRGEGKLLSEDPEGGPVNIDPLHELLSKGEAGEECSPEGPSALEALDREYPPIIRRVIHEYAAAFQERSKLHTTMTEMPEVNTESVCRARAEIFNLIKVLSERLQQLHEAKTNFEATGILPDAELLFPPEIPAEKENIDSLTEEDLKKRKKNLQSSISKDQSLLDFQSKEHTAAKNPMPQGPKRIKIQHRIAQRVQQIQDIETELLKYVIKE